MLRPAAHPAARDFAPVAAALALCPLAAALSAGPSPAALEHARTLLGAERALGLGVEPGLVRWTHGHEPLWTALGAAYLWIHLPALIGALVWVRLERPAAFIRVRNAWVAAQALTIAGNLAWPAAPPWRAARLPHGHVDGAAYLLQSADAAMPSGHVVFAAIAGGTVAALARPPLVRALGLLYPIAVVALVLMTGKHLWLDAAAGLAVAALGLAVARLLEALADGVRVARRPVWVGGAAR